MSNRTVQAAAEGLPIITRRAALRTLVASSAAGALAGGLFTLAVPAEAAADPCLAFVTGWNAASDQCANASEGASADVWKVDCEPFDRAAFAGEIPAATSAAGAAAALRKALAFGDMEQQDANLVRAALAYLDGAAS